MRRIGLDLGTTNSAIAVLGDDGKVRLAHFPHANGVSDTFRSILYFRAGEKPVGGPRAIDAYLAAESEGRLIQSMKSYLADRTFQATSIFGRTTSLVGLIGLLLRELRAEAEKVLGPLGSRAVVGRPVHFASEEWIREDTEKMASCVDDLLARVGVEPRDVDQVFLTGGSSLVPAVRRIFESRFGADRIRAGGELISVASGLALRAAP